MTAQIMLNHRSHPVAMMPVTNSRMMVEETIRRPGLVMLNANPYLYRLVNSLIIFVADWVDGQRSLMTERIEQRKIHVEA